MPEETFTDQAVTVKPARKLLAIELHKTRDALTTLLHEVDPNHFSQRDYAVQRDLMIKIQSYQFALDVLAGHIGIDGQPVAHIPASLDGDIDRSLDELDEAIREGMGLEEIINRAPALPEEPK